MFIPLNTYINVYSLCANPSVYINYFKVHVNIPTFPWLFQNFCDLSIFHYFSRPGNDHFKIPWLFQVFHDRTHPARWVRQILWYRYALVTEQLEPDRLPPRTVKCTKRSDCVTVQTKKKLNLILPFWKCSRVDRFTSGHVLNDVN